MKVSIERANRACPSVIPLCYFIKFRFDTCREVVVYDAGELCDKEVVHYNPNIGGKELTFVCSVDLSSYLTLDGFPLASEDNVVALLPLTIASLYVASILYCLNGWRIGRGAAYA